MLHVENANCRYSKAKRVCTEAFSLAERLAQKGISFNRAVLYSEHSALLFAQSLYDEVSSLCIKLKIISSLHVTHWFNIM